LSARYSAQLLARREPPGFSETKRLSYGGYDEVRIADRSQRDERGAVGEPVLRAIRHLLGEPRLTDAARAGQRDEARAFNFQHGWTASRLAPDRRAG
jgi:hypothetical protein